MMRFFNALLSTSVLLVFSFSQSLAAEPAPPGGHLNIEEVAVTIGDPDTTLEINGMDLDFGGPLAVTLAGVPATVTSATSTTIVATVLTASFPPGDYLLTVSTGTGQSQNDEYDLTIVAVGPPDLSDEVCSLYALTGVPAPPSLVGTESPEATCDDGLDNDCDGNIDDADSDCAPPVVCPCADAYAEAIEVYTREGGNFGVGWDFCVVGPSTDKFTRDETEDIQREPFIILTSEFGRDSRFHVCGASVDDNRSGGLFGFEVRPISEPEHEACVALQATICE